MPHHKSGFALIKFRRRSVNGLTAKSGSAMKRPRSKRAGSTPGKSSSSKKGASSEALMVEDKAVAAVASSEAMFDAPEPSADDQVDFSQLRGVGEDSDDSDPDAPLQFLKVSELPSQVVSESRNDEPALDKKLADTALFDTAEPHHAGKLPFRESLSVTMPIETPLGAALAIDDLARERKFAELTTEAVHIGLDKLRAGNIKFRRPDDYFAQMIKSDAHMTRVKTRMLDTKANIQNAVTNRNNRDVVKNKKKVRQEQRLKQQEKQKQTKDEIQAVSKLRKDRVRRRAENEEAPSDDDEFPIDLLNIEQLDVENKFQPARDIVNGKKKAWAGNNLKFEANKKGKGKDRGDGKRDGPAGIKKKRGSKKRLGKSRRQKGPKTA